MMNVSELLTTIKMDLGIYGLALPIDDLDDKIMEVIKLRTIKTYSQFFPHIQKLEINLQELEYTTNNFNQRSYILPDIFGDRRIVSIRDVEQIGRGTSGYTYPEMNFGLFEDFALGQANANIASAMSPPTTFEFINPNKLTLYNTYLFNNRVIIEFALEHFSNLQSIPPSQWETFEEWAIVDVKQFLYGILKHYNEIQTAHGTINLHIDDWANANQERKELLEKWRQVYHLDNTNVYYI